MHHLKPELSAAIVKDMNQMPTTKSDAHWLILVVTPNTGVTLLCQKEETHQQLPLR